MTSLAIAAGHALLIARPGSRWSVEAHLAGQRTEAVAVDPGDPMRLYVGSWGNGVWRSADGGRSWEPAGAGIPHADVTAVGVGHTAPDRPGLLYAGTEPSTLSKSPDFGESWQQLPAMLELPSSPRWSFPPKPETHHVRWIEADPNVPGRLFVAIEAGALLRTPDGGETWIDRVQGGPIDTHTAATHREARDRLYSSAGDGYFQSDDGGVSWSRPMAGLRHGYLVGVAVDPGDPDTVVVSGASGPYASYWPRSAQAYLYRKTAGQPFELTMEGLPDAHGTVASRLATHPDEPGIFYAVNNHGLFRSQDGGRRWQPLEIPWPEGVFDRGVNALAAFAE